MSDLPVGTVTFLYSDIEGSTRRWEQHPDVMKAAVERHDAILREAIETNHGRVFRTMGDAFCAVFSVAPSALRAAVVAQRALYSEPWNEQVGPIRVRMALHTGIGEVRDGDYVGQALNRIARLLSVAHGGQTLLSRPTRDLVGDALPPDVSLRDLGEHSLKDLQRTEYVFQLVIEGLPAEFPPLNTTDVEGRPNNLPAELSLFVGRERELEAVQRLLRRPDIKLLTLTGPGGTGKTRLAQHAAANAINHFRDGVFFVGLASIIDPQLVVPTIAQVLGMKETSGQTLEDSLKDYLRDKQILLVLDNLEHLTDAATSVAHLLVLSTQLKIIVTSQVVLHIKGEQEYPVPPLALPDPDRLPPLETVSQFEAIDLFVQRARLVKPDFEVTDQNARAVIEICYLLDGLPLAIELAAARIKLLSPEAMLARLSGMAGMQNSLKLLVGGARDLPARQQALRSTMEWSYGLLDEGEKALFRRFSVFAGGCTLEAAEAVCGDETDNTDVLEGIGSLVDRSLLRGAALPGDNPSGDDMEPRFSMLKTIRGYASERLEESGEAQSTRRRHAGYYLALAEKAEYRMPLPASADNAEYRMPLPAHTVRRDSLETEQENLRSALHWALEQGATETALRMSGALPYFWQRRGNMSEGRLWIDAAVALPGAGQERAAYAQALMGAGTIAWLQGDPAAARAWCEESAAIYRELGDKRGLAGSLLTLGQSTLFLGDATLAGSLVQEALALYRETGLNWGTAQSLFVSAQVSESQKDYGAARSHFEESLALYGQLGDDWWAAQTMNSLGDLARMQGDYARARTLYEESLALFRELRARTDIPASLHNLGHLAIIQGNIAEATKLFQESLAMHREAGNKPGIVESLAGFAALAAAQREPERAARLFGASATLHAAISAPEWPAEVVALQRNISIAREQLDEDAWLAAWEQGKAMSMEQAVSYALNEPAAGL